MNSLKLHLSLLGKTTQFEKDLTRLTYTPNRALPQEKVVISLLKALREDEAHHSDKHHTQMIMKHLHSAKHWEDAAKLLIVAHQAIHEEISPFVHEFAAAELQNIIDLPNHTHEFKQYVRCGLIKFYYRYLKKLADAHYSVKKCRRYSPGDQSGLLQKHDSQLIFQHSQLKELVYFAVKAIEFFICSDDVCEIDIDRLIGEMILRDCIEFYNIICRFITKNIESVFHLPDDLALALDSVYADLIRLKEPMSSFYGIKRFFFGAMLTSEPNYYQFNRTFNTKEELYINSIRKQRRKARLAASQSMIMLPEKTCNLFSIDDDEHRHLTSENEKEHHHHIRTEGYDESKSKSSIKEKKYSADYETLLTNKPKHFPDDIEHDLIKEDKKKSDTNSNLATKPSDPNTANFSKIPNLD